MLTLLLAASDGNMNWPTALVAIAGMIVVGIAIWRM